MDENMTTPAPNNTSAAPTSKRVKLSGKFVALVAVVLVIALGLIGWMAWTMLSGNNTMAAGDSNLLPQATITSKGFTPATIKIKQGQSVTWTNRDTANHRLMADTNQQGAPNFDSEDALGLNETYTYTFNTPGTYTYHDAQNPVALKGVVVVESGK